MLHRVQDYTDRDLLVAISSPFQPDVLKEQCQAEYLRRKQEIKDELKGVFNGTHI
jgi:hypothetical protein